MERDRYNGLLNDLRTGRLAGFFHGQPVLNGPCSAVIAAEASKLQISSLNAQELVCIIYDEDIVLLCYRNESREQYRETKAMTDLNTLLEAERERLEAEQDSLQEKVRQAADQLAHVRSRLEHVLALLGKEKGTASSNESSRASSSRDDNTPPTICDIAAEILGERNAEPMYYKELAEEIEKRGGILKGQTPWATLTARMVQDERFVRPTAKGFYALRRDYPTARNVGARLRGNRRRRGS